MIINYKFGFKEGNIMYGWHNKELYRLPQMIGKRYYPIKKMMPKLWNNKKSKGYLIASKRMSMQQLESKTIFINQKIQQINDSDTPF